MGMIIESLRTTNINARVMPKEHKHRLTLQHGPGRAAGAAGRRTGRRRAGRGLHLLLGVGGRVDAVLVVAEERLALLDGEPAPHAHDLLLDLPRQPRPVV